MVNYDFNHFTGFALHQPSVQKNYFVSEIAGRSYFAVLHDSTYITELEQY